MNVGCGGRSIGRLLSPRENVCPFPIRKSHLSRLAATYFLLFNIGKNDQCRRLFALSNSAYIACLFYKHSSVRPKLVFSHPGTFVKQMRSERSWTGATHNLNVRPPSQRTLAPEGVRRPLGRSACSAPTRNSATGGEPVEGQLTVQVKLKRPKR